MSLKALRRRVSCWIQRPMGQLAGLLLLLAMISAGAPGGKVHAHADGAHDHDHHAQLADGPSDHAGPAVPVDPITDTVLHAHDVCTAVSVLPALPVIVLDVIAPGAALVRITASPPSSSARIPPHRPPIA